MVVKGEVKVSGGIYAGTFKNMLAGTNEFDHRKRKISKMIQIGCLLLEEKIIQRFGIGLRRKLASLCGCQLHDTVPALRSSQPQRDRKSTRLNSSHQIISYAVFCLKKKKT